jgi:hypothetical protein
VKFERPKPAPHRNGAVGIASDPRQDRVMTGPVAFRCREGKNAFRHQKRSFERPKTDVKSNP